MEKNMFFVNPEMPSKTFVMVLKKLPDHFKNNPCLDMVRQFGMKAREHVQQYEILVLYMIQNTARNVENLK